MTSSSASLTVLCRDLGRLSYAEGLAVQAEYEARVALEKEGAGVLLLVEHDPVLTVGRAAEAGDLGLSAEAWRARGIEVHDTNRGGKVTYHGPGQVVLYPILNLNCFGRDVRAYVAHLEETAIRFVEDYGVAAARDDEHTGVWVGRDKIAAIGVHVRRWVTTHGMAVNVGPALDVYGQFVPCGIRERGVTSLSKILGREVDLNEAKKRLAVRFAEVFGVTVLPRDSRD